MRESLLRCGFTEKTAEEKTDFFIINSCTVTAKADKDTRNLIRHFHRINPEGKIAVTGCYAELDSDRKEIARMPGVTHLVRNSEKARIGEMLATSLSTTGTGLSSGGYSVGLRPVPVSGAGITDFKDRNRAFVKIQDGCDHRCSYCKVSLVRGPSRSRPGEEVASEARNLVAKGFKEIVLTGVCLGSWKPARSPYDDLEGQKNGLAGLAEKLSSLEGAFRIRLSSIEPVFVTDNLIETVKSSDKICKHFHMPLQSGDDKILRLMKRPYSSKGFSKTVKKIRNRIPDAAITTDVLVGFPGEDDLKFSNTVRFLNDIKPSRIHVFSYSRREGTAAARLEQKTGKKAVKERTGILAGLSNKFSMEFAGSFIGKKEAVVVESYNDRATALLAGYTGRYIRVLINGPDAMKNKLVPVEITGVEEDKNRVFARPSPP